MNRLRVLLSAGIVLVAVVALYLVLHGDSKTDLSQSETVSDTVRVPLESAPEGLASVSLQTDRSAPVELAEADEALVARFDQLCESSLANFQDYIDEPYDTEQAIAEGQEHRTAIKNRLAQSDVAEHLHVAALYSDDSAERLELISKAIELDPTDAHLMWTATGLCINAKGAADCPLDDWMKSLAKLDGQNTQTWMLVSTQRYKAGDSEGALDALQVAGSVQETSLFWTETITTVERGLASASDMSFPYRAVEAIGVAAAIAIPSFSTLSEMCRTESTPNSDWASACTAYMSRAASQAETEISALVAMGLHKQMLEDLGDHEAAATLERQMQARRRRYQVDGTGIQRIADALIIANPTTFYEYLTDLKSDGEIAARGRMIDIARQRLEAEPDQVCAELQIE
ncbi:MAG: hypothetical protein AAGJ86_13525 [Pseudomonadota bacterium]